MKEAISPYFEWIPEAPKQKSIESLFLDTLTPEQLSTLLPCSQQDVQQIIEERIEFLNKNRVVWDNKNN